MKSDLGSRKVEVYLGRGTARKLVPATVLSVNSRTMWVRLGNGDVVQRKIERDVPSWSGR